MSKTPDKKVDKLTKMMANVKTCRDFYEGAIKVLVDEYLPKLTGETDSGYKVRRASTAFPNLYSPIVTGLSGLITKKEPVTEGFETFPLDDIDMKGNSLANFIKQVCDSSIIAGVEFISVESNRANNRVFFKRYKYEQLTSYSIEDGKLTQMVFKETFEEADGRFGIKEVERFIVFKLGGGEVWYDVGEGLKIQDEWSNTLAEIPVVAVVTGKELSRFEYVPRLYDVAMLNKVMLNLESQLANVLSVVGNPVPVFYGEVADDGVRIGVKDALVFDDKQTQGFEYVEIEGGGVSKLQDKIKKVGEDIDKTSFSLLHKDGSKTVIDAQENQNKSSSFLSDVAEELEVKFNKLFQLMAMLDNKTIAKGNTIEFKKDFDDVLFSDQQLKMLYEMLEGGHLSRETFWNKLKLANILPKDFDPSVEKENIESDPV